MNPVQHVQLNSTVRSTLTYHAGEQVRPKNYSGSTPVNEPEARVKLILERFSIYGLSSLTSASGVSSLSNEVLQNSVKDGPVIVTFQAQLYEVSCGLQSSSISNSSF